MATAVGTKARKRATQTRRGFSLIELVVAMAILAIVAAMVSPSYVGQLQRARDSTAIGLADQLAANIAHYMAWTGSPPSASGAGWSTYVGSLGSYAELPSTQPSVFSNVAVYSDGTSTFQIQFKANSGTGSVYCRDLNGLGTLASWNSAGGPWSGCP
jgi:prepilin-type N-terminal cleavage/methylation domain-containing protein